MTRFFCLALLVGLFSAVPNLNCSADELRDLAPTFANEIPDDWEEQIDEKTESMPEEIRDAMRERLKAVIRKQLEKQKSEGESEAEDQEADADKKEAEDKKDDKAGEKKKDDSPKKDPLSEESKKLKAEMDLFTTRFKHQIALYEKEIESQRLQNEKSKIDEKLEEDRITRQVSALKREQSRLKMEVDLLKGRSALQQAQHAAEMAAAKAEKDRLEMKLTMETAREKLEDRILGDEAYPDEPFKDGVLDISLRRIELNGPIYAGAADYVCQRLDYFNNQSAKPIFLVIDNCPGGSAIEGMQIVQSIEKSKAPVHVVVKRFAASMAAIIATLADESYCYPDSIVLHHQASSMLYGTGRDLEDQMRQFNEISDRLIGAVAKKIGISEQQFIDQMYENRSSGDWDLFGDQAVERKWVGHVATTIRERGIRKRPKGTRNPPALRLILGQKDQLEASGYLERYEVALPEEVDEKGNRFVRLPRLNPVDAWLIYNPDNYYR